MENLNLLSDVACAVKSFEEANPPSKIEMMAALGLEFKPQRILNSVPKQGENNVHQEQTEPLDLSMKSCGTNYQESTVGIKSYKNANFPAQNASLHDSYAKDYQESVCDIQESFHNYIVKSIQKLNIVTPNMLFGSFGTNNSLHRKHFCMKCGDAFLTEFNLKKHYSKSHAAPKLHVCVHCKKSFATQGNLNKHTSTVHAEEKKFYCTKCGKGFSQKCNLQSHFNSQHGEKPFKCNFPACKRAFGAKATLEAHICSQHNKISKYWCEKCFKTYTRSSSLARHVRKFHGTENSNAQMC